MKYIRNNLNFRYALIFPSVLFLFFFISCQTTTRNSAFQEFDSQVNNREYLLAAQQLDNSTNPDLYRDKDQVLRYLDIGILYHIAGMHKESIAYFNEAERLIEENYTKSITDSVRSFLENDYALEYFGEAYEDLYLNIFKAIDFIELGSFDSAFVEIRRLGIKLNLLEDKYGKLAASMNAAEDSKGKVESGKTEFHNSALARYFSLLLYREDGNIDDARIDLDKIDEAFRSQPALFNFPKPDNLNLLLQKTDKARINVVSFTGRSPLKKATTLRINTGNEFIFISQEVEDNKGNLNVVNLNGISFPGIEQGYNFKAQLPEMEKRSSRVSRIQVFADSVPLGELSMIEKMDSVAIETFKLKQSMILIKTVIRTVTKGILAKQAKNTANNYAEDSGTLGSILSIIGGIALDVAVDNSEKADLRTARYFPGQAYVGEFWLEPGTHEITIDYYNNANYLLYRETIPAEDYKAGKLHLLTSYNLE